MQEISKILTTLKASEKIQLIVILLLLIIGCLAIGYAFYSMGELAYDAVKRITDTNAKIQELNIK